MSDPLQRMISKQRGLQARVAPKIYAFGEAGGADGRTFFIKENGNALMHEASELVNTVSWKMHKADFGQPLTAEQREKAVEETIDCLHFVINLLLGLGVDSSEEVERLFFDKNSVNHNRWSSGY